MDAQQELDRYNKDMDHFYRHRPQLLEQYPEQWVAIYNQRVVGAAKDIESLVKDLKEQGLEPGHVFVKYLTGDEPLLILAELDQ